MQSTSWKMGEKANDKRYLYCTLILCTMSCRCTKCFIALGILMTLLSLSFCQSKESYHHVLTEAESLMDNYPDSALVILENQVVSQNLSKSDYALWCLLLTQARDKCYVEHENDSLIQIAADYFEKGHDNKRKMLTYYYLGRVNRDLGKAPEAQDYFLKALELKDLVKDNQLLIRINSQLAFLYLYQDSPMLAIPRQEEALSYAIETNDTLMQYFMLRDIARSYSLKRDIEESLKYYQKALPLASDGEKIHVKNEIAHMHLLLKDIDSAYKCAREILDTVPEQYRTHQFNLNYGHILFELGKLDSAKFYLEKSKGSERIDTQISSYFHLYKHAKVKENWNEYALYQEKYETLVDSLQKKNFMETMITQNQLFNYQQKEKEAQKEKMKHAIAKKNNTILLLIIILIAGGIVGYSLSMRAMKKERHKLNDEFISSFSARKIKETHEQIDDNLSRIEEIENLLTDKSKSKFKDIFILEKKLLESENRRINRIINDVKEMEKELKTSDLYYKFHSDQDLKITDDDKAKLKEMINKTYPNFLISLYDICSDISEEEIWICYFMKANLSAKKIADIMYQSKQSITNKRRKIASKIFGEGSPPKLLDEIITSL